MLNFEKKNHEHSTFNWWNMCCMLYVCLAWTLYTELMLM